MCILALRSSFSHSLHIVGCRRLWSFLAERKKHNRQVSHNASQVRTHAKHFNGSQWYTGIHGSRVNENCLSGTNTSLPVSPALRPVTTLALGFTTPFTDMPDPESERCWCFLTGITFWCSNQPSFMWRTIIHVLMVRFGISTPIAIVNVITGIIRGYVFIQLYFFVQFFYSLPVNTLLLATFVFVTSI